MREYFWNNQNTSGQLAIYGNKKENEGANHELYYTNSGRFKSTSYLHDLLQTFEPILLLRLVITNLSPFKNHY